MCASACAAYLTLLWAIDAVGSLDYPISVEANGLPAPSYQWQQLITVEYNITTNSTDSNSTTNSTVSARDSFYTEREIVFVDVRTHACPRTHALHPCAWVALLTQPIRSSTTSWARQEARC
jgi:hypothetical protein